MQVPVITNEATKMNSRVSVLRHHSLEEGTGMQPDSQSHAVTGITKISDTYTTSLGLPKEKSIRG